jgi:hypothetical protein
MANAEPETTQLRIDPVVASAEEIVRRVREELSEHQGLDSAAQGVARAAREAQQVSGRLRKPWGLHRMPALFLAAALIVFGAWIYWRFLHLKTLVIALPARDRSNCAKTCCKPGGSKFSSAPPKVRGKAWRY